MALKVLLSQKTNRHVIKKLNASYVYESSFGTWQTAKSDTTGLNFPIGIAKDASNNIYVCDSNNKRIIKLNSSLTYVSQLDVSTTIGKPYSITFDTVTNDLYVVGLFKDFYLSVARITSALVVSKSFNNIYSPATGVEKPYGICKGIVADTFIISLGRKLVIFTETASSTLVGQTTTSESFTATHEEAIDSQSKYNLINKSIVPSTFTVWRTCTESPLEESPTSFQTLHFPVIGTPDVDFKVYKNGVQLDYDVALNDPNDYIINQATGDITLQTGVVTGDEVKIWYKFEMINNVDYALDLFSGLLSLSIGVSENILGLITYRDIFNITYTYATNATVQTLTGITDAVITGIIKHSNNDIYVVQNTLLESAKISRINSSYVNIGDSNKISKYAIGIAEALDGSLIVYDSSNQKIVRYSNVLNFVETIYTDTSDLVATDAYEVAGLLEANI